MHNYVKHFQQGEFSPPKNNYCDLFCFMFSMHWQLPLLMVGGSRHLFSFLLSSLFFFRFGLEKTTWVYYILSTACHPSLGWMSFYFSFLFGALRAVLCCAAFQGSGGASVSYDMPISSWLSSACLFKACTWVVSR